MTEKVLIIDDEANIVELIRYNLQASGFVTIQAYNGIDGLELAKQEIPDLVLLDLMLPGIDGLEVCKRLRRDEKLKKALGDDQFKKYKSDIEPLMMRGRRGGGGGGGGNN